MFTLDQCSSSVTMVECSCVFAAQLAVQLSSTDWRPGWVAALIPWLSSFKLLFIVYHHHHLCRQYENKTKTTKKNITILEICSDRQVNKPMNRRTCWQKNYVAATTTTMYAVTIYYNNRNTCNLKLLCTWANVFSLLEASEPSLFVCLSLLCWVALHWLTDWLTAV